MARTQRKINFIKPESKQFASKEVIYNTDGYVRLSTEDGGNPGSDTLESQKELIAGFIRQDPSLRLCHIYCDNGKTGTNFERPAFDQMIDNVRSGKTNCIVVKDLSRFGRNYKEAGNYIDRIFPVLGVRFIAINDHLDTLVTQRNDADFIVPLKNIINDIYSRDISRKIGSTFETKKKKGEYTGAWAPYGYQKSPDDSHYLIPDPTTAPIVQKMFQWRMEGLGYNGIAKKLNMEGILSPKKYRYLKETNQCPDDKNMVWTSSTVKFILSQQVYMGHMVQGKTHRDLSRGITNHTVSPEEWIVVRNTHEPLISQKTFEAVQEVGILTKKQYNETVSQNDMESRENIFRGLVYCADCGKALIWQRNHGPRLKKICYRYACKTHMVAPEVCQHTQIREDVLREIVFQALKVQVTLAADLKKIAHQLHKMPAIRQNQNMLQQQIAALETQLNRTRSFSDQLYRSYQCGDIDKLEYQEFKRNYQEKLAEQQAELICLLGEQKADTSEIGTNKWLQVCERCINENPFSRQMIQEMIEKIEVDKRNQITIHFCYQDDYKKFADYITQLQGGGIA